MKKLLITTAFAFLALGCIAFYQYFQIHDNKLHVVFCSVGQGDAVFIRTPENKHVLIDAGPDSSVLNCLSRHMAFWERKLDLIFLTHPHADHYSGLYYVLERYNTTYFVTDKVSLEEKEFQNLKKIIGQKHIAIKPVSRSDSIHLSKSLVLSIESPDSGHLELSTKNERSMITELSYGSFNTLLTGDTQSDELLHVIESISQSIEVLQLPHHGSKTGTVPDLFNKLKPKLAVISVGKNNRYNLPNVSVLQMLKEQKVPLARTDQAGDVEIVSDGKGWVVRK